MVAKAKAGAGPEDRVLKDEGSYCDVASCLERVSGQEGCKGNLRQMVFVHCYLPLEHGPRSQPRDVRGAE